MDNFNPMTDEITFKFIQSPLTDEETDKSGNKTVLTKRTLLSTLAKIFDSQGTLSPYLLSAKLILQKAWEQKLAWDEPLSGEIEQDAEILLSELDQL